MAFTLESPAFEQNSKIPIEYTCEGYDKSPRLQWSGVPKDTKSLVLILDDPDAPDPKAPKMTYVHWVLYNLPATSAGLKEGVSSQELPTGTKEGLNDWKRTGYGGPCPPIGEHRYFFKLYALNEFLPDLGTPTKAKVLEAMQGKIIAETQLIGTYIKKK